MGTLNGELTITQLSNADGTSIKPYRLFRLEEPLIYYPTADPLRVIIVPAQFISDGPSIPRFLWWFLDVWGIYSRAGFIHDYLCFTISISRPHKESPRRQDADKIFRQACRDCGTGWIDTALLYFGVWLGTRLRIKTTMAAHNKRVIDMMGTDGV
jgi:hypothetical protein